MTDAIHRRQSLACRLLCLSELLEHRPKCEPDSWLHRGLNELHKHFVRGRVRYASTMFPMWIVKGASTVIRIVGTGIHALRHVPAVDDLFDRMQANWLSPVVIRRIRRADDLDLVRALNLSGKRLPQGLQWEDADLIRWIKENESISPVDTESPRDYLFIAKFKREVEGLLLLHHYPTEQTLFLAYMVVGANRKGLRPNEVSSRLLAYVIRYIRRDKSLSQTCRLLFEVVDPRCSATSKQLEDLARIKLLCSLAASHGFSVRTFDFDYRQPRLVVPADQSPDEHRLLLMSISLKPETRGAASSQVELMRQLRFMFTCLYPEGFSDDPDEQARYQDYCRSLYERVLSRIPDSVTCLNPVHMTYARKIRRRGKSSLHESDEA